MERPEEFSTCPLCGSDVKLKNMLDHKFRVHKEDMDTEEKKSLKESGWVTDEELKVACDMASNMMDDGEFREATKLFRKVVQADPSNFGAWNDLGLCQMKLNRPREALDSFEKSVEVNPEFAHGWLQRGNILFIEEGEVSEAGEYYEKAVEHNPELLQAWYNLGNVHLKKGNWEEAIRCFDKAIELNDEYYMAWLSKAQALGKIGKSREAKKCFKRADDLNSDYVDRFVFLGMSDGNTFKEASGMRPKEDEDKR